MTAVDIFFKTLCDKGYFKVPPFEEYKEAKELERELLVKAYKDGNNNEFRFNLTRGEEWVSAEQYYKEKHDRTADTVKANKRA